MNRRTAFRPSASKSKKPRKQATPPTASIRFPMQTPLSNTPTQEALAKATRLVDVYALLVQAAQKMLHSAQADDWDTVEKINSISDAAIAKIQSLESEQPLEKLSVEDKSTIKNAITQFLQYKEEILAIAEPKMAELKQIILGNSQNKGFMGNTGYF